MALGGTYTGLGFIAGSSAEALALTYVTASDAGSASSNDLDYSSIGIGATPSAGYDRYIIAAVSAPTGGNSLSSATIASNSASIVVQDIAAFYTSAMVIYGPLNSGTTADFSFTFAGAPSEADRLHVYRLIVSQANIGFTQTAYDTASVNNETDPDVLLDVPMDGSAVAVKYSYDFGTPSQGTWAGLTEDNDAAVTGSSSLYAAAAHDDFAASQENLTVGFTHDASPNFVVLIAASWSPG